MIARIIVLIILLFSTNSLYSDTTWVQNPIEERVWTVDGNPYIIPFERGASLRGNDTLIIEPGVTILFESYLSGLFISDSSVIMANGVEEDSIYFLPLNRGEVWGAIFIRSSASVEFSHCVFAENGGNREEYSIVMEGLRGQATFSHCTFREGPFGYYIVASGRGTTLIVENCYFVNIPGGGVGGSSADVIVRGTVFQNVGLPASRVDMDNCIIIERGISVWEDYSTRNTIFINAHMSFRGDFEDSTFFDRFGNNIFWGRENHDDYFYHPEDINEIGVLSRTNSNGDSTDAYGNLFMDPLFVGEGNYPEFYHLQPESPCIDAGHPESDPDPDSTIADIGAFYFPQCNIRIDPSFIEFIDIPVGENAEAELTIRNVGLQPLIINDVTIEQEGNALGFHFDEWENIEPDSSWTLLIVFDSDIAGEFEATLIIESNDRDEPEVRIILTGAALGVNTDQDVLPGKFAITEIAPNPFNSSVKLSMYLPKADHVSFSIFDVNGREVSRLVDGNVGAGSQTFVWNASDFPAGVYVVRMEAGDAMEMRKVVLVR